jgi:two-component system, NtrC family, response regulator AtoC
MAGSEVAIDQAIERQIALPDAIKKAVVGRSRAMQDIMRLVMQVAQSPATTVFLQGESGTGKEVIARAIHLLSGSPNAPFVAINCAAIPESLLETELFGVEAGAFTDARLSRDGQLWQANHGTLFLDEIGSMPLSLQAKLLRFLETRTFRRVGSTKEMHVNLRVISAANEDMQRALTQKTFRPDLYYRLNVITLTLPPLRERREDITLLACHFLHLLNEQHAGDGTRQPSISAEAMVLLERYSWPGNVRELRSAIEYSHILSDGSCIMSQDLPEHIQKMDVLADTGVSLLQQQIHLPRGGIDLPAFLHGVESALIEEALTRCNGNQMRAASLLGMSRDQLRYRLLHRDNHTK